MPITVANGWRSDKVIPLITARLVAVSGLLGGKMPAGPDENT